MAENLADWKEGGSRGSIGDAPFGEAENWYQNRSRQFKKLIDLYQAESESQSKTELGVGSHGVAHGLALGGYAFWVSW